MVIFTTKPNISILSSEIAVFTGFITCFGPAILNLMQKLRENAKVLLGRRIRALRNVKGWTQQELGSQADINYKFLGEIERGQQNPSFNVLVKIATALGVELLELFRFEQDISDRNDIEARIKQILKTIPNEGLSQILLLLRVLYPIH